MRWSVINRISGLFLLKIIVYVPLLTTFLYVIMILSGDDNWHAILSKLGIAWPIRYHSIILIFYGMWIMAIGYIVHSVGCPEIVNRHSDGNSYFMAESNSMSIIRKTETFNMLKKYGYFNGYSPQTVEISDIMISEYNYRDESKGLLRHTVTLTYFIGAGLCVAPIVYRLIKITLSLI